MNQKLDAGEGFLGTFVDLENVIGRFKIFEYLGNKITFQKDVETYVNTTRMIKALRSIEIRI
ncbi:hypothetical protein [Ulvibacterium marinum]|uniref:hypothetical protein n=1 Tax=Ulvibacterium marinum TaxID=2419782 RepID=UPI002494570C|nr:hypothetical protein [Ulvibacterium marinum]